MSQFSLKSGLSAFLTAILLGGGMAHAAVSAAPLQAEQTRSCTGIVVDEAGQPVIGATVLIKGTLKGTSTDLDGRFTLSDAKTGDVIQVSSIGYLTAEAVWNGNPLNIIISEDRLSLEESVVVGYGVQKKVNVTGAVSMVGSEVLESRPVKSVSQALQGQIPGLNFSVTTGGGELNQNMSFNVRGTGTVGQGSAAAPLVLIDGIEGDMNTINPNDVENISVLKDAAASSIYGARGAFGVILITTKSGKAGKTQVSYSGNVNVNSALRMPRMLPSDKFVRYFNRAAANSGQTSPFEPTILQRIEDYNAGRITTGTIPKAGSPNQWGSYEDGNGNTDWFQEFYGGRAPSHQHNLSISGSFQNTKGLLRFGSDIMNRYSIDAKVGVKLAEWARLDYATKWTREDYSRPTYLTYAMWGSPRLFMHNIARRWPNVPVYDPNGNLMDGMETAAMRDGGVHTTQNNYYTNQLGLVLEPVKDWRIHFEGNMRTYTARNHAEILPIYANYVDGTPYAIAFASGGTSPGLSRVEENRRTEDYFTTNIYSDYSWTIADAHNFHLLGGFNAELTKYDTMRGQGDNLTDISVPWLSQTTTQPVIGGGREHHAVAGFFGRFNYNYLERYMLEINGRYDGSSRFVGDKRWGFFPSVSAGWNIAKEDFFAPLAEKISTLKLRASWGSLGNTNTNNWYPFYQTMPTGSANGAWVIDDKKPNTASMPGIVSDVMTWESIETIDAGLDVTALDGRLSGSFDWFIRKTNNMIGPAPELPAILGAAAPQVNNADMKSVGWELELSWRDQIGKDFSYGVRAVLSDATQTITRYPNETGSLSSYYVGRKIGEIWGYESTRLAQTQEEMDAWLANNRPSWGSNWGAGDLMYVDQNGDGVVDSGAYTLEDHGDLKIIGNSTPRYNFGITLDAAWKGIDIRAYLQGVAKRDYRLSSMYFYGANTGMWQSAGFVEHWDFWRPEGDELGANTDAYFPKPAFDNGGKNFESSTRYLQNAAYMRLKNIQLGYTLPRKISEKAGMSMVRFYVSGENLFTLTKMFKVFDPETISGDWGEGKVYPLMKTYSFGVNINF